MPLICPYSFLPWSASRRSPPQIDQPDHLGADPDAGPKGRATLTAELTLDAVRGPGRADAAPAAVSQDGLARRPGRRQGLKPERDPAQRRPAAARLQRDAR